MYLTLITTLRGFTIALQTIYAYSSEDARSLAIAQSMLEGLGLRKAIAVAVNSWELKALPPSLQSYVDKGI